MNKTTIRKVILEDLDQLRSLAVRTFTESFSGMNTEENMQHYLASAFTPEKLADELSSPGAEFYFAMADEKAAGYLKINTGQAQTELREENGLEIERIYVLQEFQGQKIGQQLFDKAQQIAKQKKCGFIWLGVWEENTKAIQFYRKNGFVVFDKHIFKLGGDEQTDLMMKKEMGE
jgi:diamine N-acetyltransferase